MGESAAMRLKSTAADDTSMAYGGTCMVGGTNNANYSTFAIEQGVICGQHFCQSSVVKSLEPADLLAGSCHVESQFRAKLWRLAGPRSH